MLPSQEGILDHVPLAVQNVRQVKLLFVNRNPLLHAINVFVKYELEAGFEPVTYCSIAKDKFSVKSPQSTTSNWFSEDFQEFNF